MAACTASGADQKPEPRTALSTFWKNVQASKNSENSKGSDCAEQVLDTEIS